MKFSTLDAWLDWQEGLNPQSIELGLARVDSVWQKLIPPDLSSSIVITIAGTNGKGSTVALFESILKQAGYRTGSYTSPHLIRYNERIRLDGQAVSDEHIMQAFQRIEAVRGDLPLTYFEHGTLAALHICAAAQTEVTLLEVGLGGRLDAVNIIDADLAMVTSIDLDHQAWLGSDREAIGREKAGIFRAGHPAVFSGRDMPRSVARVAEELGTPLYLNGRDFRALTGAGSWTWLAGKQSMGDLPLPALTGAHQMDNAAGVIMALRLLNEHLTVPAAAVREGLQAVALDGRYQIIRRRGVEWILDVAHNPQAVRALKENLRCHPVPGCTLAILGMLQDKSPSKVINILQDIVDEWHFATLRDPRGLSAQQVAPAADAAHYESVADAVSAVAGRAHAGDRVVALGSFHTVGEALTLLGEDGKM